MSTDLRRPVRAALTKANLTISKKVASRVKGLPLTTRGFVVQRFGDDATTVEWTAGTSCRTRPEELAAQLNRALEALEGFKVEKQETRLVVTGRR